jgi:hypothetical protein
MEGISGVDDAQATSPTRTGAIPLFHSLFPLLDARSFDMKLSLCGSFLFFSTCILALDIDATWKVAPHAAMRGT